MPRNLPPPKPPIDLLQLPVARTGCRCHSGATGRNVASPSIRTRPISLRHRRSLSRRRVESQRLRRVPSTAEELVENAAAIGPEHQRHTHQRASGHHARCHRQHPRIDEIARPKLLVSLANIAFMRIVALAGDPNRGSQGWRLAADRPLLLGTMCSKFELEVFDRGLDKAPFVRN
jgi:hypothetical protein